MISSSFESLWKINSNQYILPQIKQGISPLLKALMCSETYSNLRHKCAANYCAVALHQAKTVKRMTISQNIGPLQFTTHSFTQLLLNIVTDVLRWFTARVLSPLHFHCPKSNTNPQRIFPQIRKLRFVISPSASVPFLWVNSSCSDLMSTKR